MCFFDGGISCLSIPFGIRQKAVAVMAKATMKIIIDNIDIVLFDLK